MHSLRSCTASMLLLAAMACSILSPTTATAEELQEPIHQLRVYEIFDGNKQGFHDRFRDHAMRIMARHGFRIVATWETKNVDRTEFVYLLEWPDKATMKSRWTEFMADPEWASIKKETAKAHGAMVGDIQDRTLELTDYSPRDRLIN
jgi:NIPSNAP protein